MFKDSGAFLSGEPQCIDSAVITGIQEKYHSKVPEGHHPRGTTVREALRGNLPLRRFCGGLSEGSVGALRGLSEGSEGLCGGPRDFSRVFGGSDPMLVTLRNCWIPLRPNYYIINSKQWDTMRIESQRFVSVATPAEPRGEKNFSLCKF